MRDGRVLLIQRRRDPWRGRWDIPGGFCDGREHPMITAERELKEETGVVGRAVALVGMWLDSYPDDNGTHDAIHTLNAAYLVAPSGDVDVSIDDAECTDAAWHPLDDLPEQLAFPDHARLALDAARVLLEKPVRTAELLDRPPGYG